MKKKILIIILILIILIFICIQILPGRGSKYYAHKWYTIFQKIDSIEKAKREYPDISIYKISDGEWIFGISDDSHASIFGGTIVVRDSKGNVRCFFGHVCGEKFINAIFFQSKINLRYKGINGVYKIILEKIQFDEYKIAEENE